MNKLRVLHFEDSSVDALLVRRAMERGGFQLDWQLVNEAKGYKAALEQGGLDLILADNGLPGFSGEAALELARQLCPSVPFIFVSGAASETLVKNSLAAGAADFVLKDHLWQLLASVRRLQRAQPATPSAGNDESLARQYQAMRRLVTAVQELSLARTVDAVAAVVRRAARELTGADGATFVLREDDKCSYVDEDAISPLWKGQRFPLSACISGWAMLNCQPAVIPDIYADPRIPVDAYRPTFVKSLVMVPIRTAAPIGAIGNYWAQPHEATTAEVELLQALANTTSVAMENIKLYAELEQRVEERTQQLAMANHELEAFSASVSHDLRTPLRSINVLAALIKENPDNQLAPEGQSYLDRVQEETRLMASLIDDLLRLARFTRIELHTEEVSLSQLAERLSARLLASDSQRTAEFKIQPGLTTRGDAGLLQVVLENLLANAWKYTARKPHAIVEFGLEPQADGSLAYFVKDNGAGFSMSFIDKLFHPFQRLHPVEEFSGTGIGLATVQRIIHRHGGKVWAVAEVDKGATFFFTLPPAAPKPH
jgi:signal transduction histidine kinase/CheY-like chemotaxis protein